MSQDQQQATRANERSQLFMANCYCRNQGDRLSLAYAVARHSGARLSHKCDRPQDQSRSRIRPISKKHVMCWSLLATCWLILISEIKSQNIAKSELNYDNQALGAIPANICGNFSRLVGSEGETQQVDAASFAHNDIQTIKASAFVCIGRTLKILSLRHNRIELISDDAFSQLDRVQVLLLDNNRLNSIPSIETLRPMISLRHLDLANNRIEWINNNSFGPSSNNLISLNLRSNPLKHLAVNSLAGLVKLKTLLMSQSALSGQLESLMGLTELRFLHVDRAADLSSVSTHLCVSSRRLTSLVLKSNQIQQVPQFAHCQDLLLLDLSYNQLAGELAANFTNQVNLIDLYLNHNRLEFVDANAFSGLQQLQVLELGDNRLKRIHPAAFVPSSGSLIELGLSNNPQLDALPVLGLEQLLVFKAFGNPKLRELPHLRQAKSLWLTYAYHCCDYLSGTILELGAVANQTAYVSVAHSTQSSDSLLVQLVSLMVAKLIGLLGPAGAETTANKPFDDHEAQHLKEADNFSELVLWPEAIGRRQRRPSGFDTNAWPTQGSLLWLGQGGEPLVAESEIASHKPRRRLKRMQQVVTAKSKRRRQRSEEIMQHNGKQRLIDELVREVKHIRWSHQVGSLNHRHDLHSTSFGHSTAAPAEVINSEELDLALWRGNMNEAGSVVEAASRQLARDLDELSSTRGRRDVVPAGKVRCLPEPSAFLPCRDLFDSWWLRAGIWSVFGLAFAGNILVILVLSSVRSSSSTSALTSIMWLAHSKRHIDVPRFLVINLAVADLLMAIYLGLLAFVDLSTLGQFKLFAIKWQYSTGCKLAGFLGVLSSELSVFILAIITLERNYAITNAVHLNRRLSLQKAMVIMFIGYTFAICMALAPLNGINDYRKFSICLPLDIESSLGSRLYLAALIGINTLSFMLLLGCYLRMYCAIRGSQAWNANDLRIAKRMSILVLTDFLCWMPIILVAIGSLLGYNLIGLDGLKVLTIFVLPLNSVANPFLYAITTKKFKRDLKTLRRRLRFLAPLGGDHVNNQMDHKDSKIFANYNQYQQNLVLRKRMARRHHLTNNDLAPECQFNRRLSRQVRYIRTQTLNQVTVNPTTQTWGTRQLEDSLNLDMTCQPRIILDPVCMDDREQAGHDLHRSGNPYLLTRPEGFDESSPPRPISFESSTSQCQSHCLKDSNKSTKLLKSCSSALGERRLLRVEPNPVDRAASACSYHHPRIETKLSATTSHHILEPNASASCETIVRRGNPSSQGGGPRLSRSINKLLFSPIAKAWSSIQISLSSSNTQIAASNINTNGTCTCCESTGKPSRPVSRKNSDRDFAAQTSSTIDELLLLSSPSMRTFKGERRMSRSCDMITSQIPQSPTSSLHDPTTSTTTTSHGDYDDDQRILLATINRLRADERTTVDPRQAQQPPLYHKGQYLKNRCTRCRSWSPALLSKLEDCIYQIKSRIPKLKSAKETKEQEPETMSQDSNGSSNPETVARQHLQCDDELENRSSSSEDGCHPGGLRMKDEHKENSDHAQPDDSEDQFNERDLVDGSFRRDDMAFKLHTFRHLRRLQHQSSVNSDTLSTRTGGTLLTNMSISFDSNTSIANLVSSKPEEASSQRGGDDHGKNEQNVDFTNVHLT